MIEEDIQWLNERPHLLGNIRPTQEDLKRIFKIYNAITGENKPYTSCGRCIWSVKQRLKQELTNINKTK